MTSHEDHRDNAHFDILIANPPYSVNSFKSTVKDGDASFVLFDKFTDKSSEIECLFIERMKQLLKVGGYAGIILPSSVLSNTGICTSARELLLQYFQIVAITEFGSNTFMATNTSTITLFLKRRPNRDHKHIENAVQTFFDKPRDVTVLGIEKAFSKYVACAFDSLSLDDYIAFINQSGYDTFKKEEAYEDYCVWFDKLNEVKKLKESKTFQAKTDAEQETILSKLLYEKIVANEKEKIMYFLLTYGQKTLLTKAGEGQEEKAFLGYEFSKFRGHEGIKMLPEGTKLYDEADQFNSEKANYYVYSAFQKSYPDVDEVLQNNIEAIDTHELLGIQKIPFEKQINLNASIKVSFDTKYPKERLSKNYDVIKGVVYDKKDQVYRETGTAILTADNITLENYLEIVKTVYLDEAFEANEAAKLLKNDIFMCLSSGSRKHIGKVAYIKEDLPYFAGGFMGIVRQQKQEATILPKYVYSVLSMPNVRSYMGKVCTGNNIKNLNDNDIDIRIPAPPSEVQQKIVEALSKIEIEEAKSIDQVSALKKQLNNGAWFSFESERIEKIATMVVRGKSAKYGSSEIQIIKSGQARGYNAFDFSKKYYVSDTFVSDERNLQKGDILINSTGVGTAGRVTLFDLDGDFVVDSHITSVRLNQEKAVPKYVLYALANIGFKNIEAMATGQSGQIELALPTVNAIKIPLPPFEKQREIADQIAAIEEKIQGLEAEIAGAEERKQAVLEKYLK